MALTDQQYIEMTLLELNVLDDARSRGLMTMYWDLHADKGGKALQYLYAKRSAIDALLGGTWTGVDIKEEDEWQYLSQRVKNLQTMRDNVNAEIVRLGGSLSVSVPTTSPSVFITASGAEFG